MSPKLKRQPPAREFSKYIATFQSDPLKKSIKTKSVNPKAWTQFGPILSSSNGYIEYTQESQETTLINPGRNSNIIPLGFNFNFNETDYTHFVASTHGWIALLDPNNYPNETSLDTVYVDRLLVSGSSSYDNSSIKESFQYNDLLLAPWFDRQMMISPDLDSFVSYFSGSNDVIASQKENFLFGKVVSNNQPYNENNFGLKYARLNDSIEGKSIVIRWSTMGYEYRGKKLVYETVLYENGKIEFNYDPIAEYSIEYTLLGLSANPENIWKLDEESGSAVEDFLNNQDLLYKNGGQMRPTEGQINTCAFFSGSSNTVIYTNNGSFANYSINRSFSFSAWFKSAVGDSSNKTILGRHYYDYSVGYSLQLLGGYLTFTLASNYYAGNRIRVQSDTDPYNDGAWYHVVVSYDGSADASGIKIYVNGAEITTTVVTNNLNEFSNIQAGSGGADFMIGAIGVDTSNNQQFTGSIDDIARWDDVLTAADVDIIYQHGANNLSVADIDLIGDSTTSYATCGIFISGSSTWEYRDFSTLLGSSSIDRTESEFGGSIYTSSYAENDQETGNLINYGSNIGINHWPKHGGRIIFSPPQRRRQIIRSDLQLKDRKDYFTAGGFDDRRTLNYVSDYNIDPTTSLPLSAIVKPSYPGIHLKMNLIPNDGIQLTNSQIIRGSHVSFVEDESYLLEKTSPFSENSPSLGRLTDSFFLTGSISNFGENPRSFARSIENKKQIKLEFEINKKTKMLSSASSIYYLNIDANQWNIPTNSLSDHLYPLEKLAVRTSDAVGGTCAGSIYLEDKIGFDSHGNSIVSGSLNIFRSTSEPERNQSTADIAKPFNTKDYVKLLSPEYPKSIQRNSSYDASNSEIFTLPIDEPFLLEKAIIEIPFCMGDGWFSDKTLCTFVSSSNFAHTSSLSVTSDLPAFNFIDEGGPAVTVSLFCQKSNGLTKVRDLVCKSTFSHIDDERNNVEFSNLETSGSSNLAHIASLTGNENNPNIISDYVPYEIIDTKKQFTGSILIKSNATISNYANITSIKIIPTNNIDTGSILLNFNEFLETEFIPATTQFFGYDLRWLLNFNSFGRSMSGFSAGYGQFLTTEDTLFPNDFIRNPFYLTDVTLKQEITASLDTQLNSLGTGSYIYFVAKSPLGKPKQQPYIVYPEDKFILAVAKSRPAFKNIDIRINDDSLSNGKISEFPSSSYYNNITDIEGHEIFFNTGSIKITLYGSNVRAGEEIQ